MWSVRRLHTTRLDAHHKLIRWCEMMNSVAFTTSGQRTHLQPIGGNSWPGAHHTQESADFPGCLEHVPQSSLFTGDMMSGHTSCVVQQTCSYPQCCWICHLLPKNARDKSGVVAFFLVKGYCNSPLLVHTSKHASSKYGLWVSSY
jgi:hypothetical protein